MRRFVSIFLMFFMILSSLPLGAFAAESTYTDALSYNKTVTASGYTNGNEMPGNAVDGDPNTKWCVVEPVTDENDVSCHWLEVDLDTVQTVTSWKLVSKLDSEPADRDYSYQIVSNFELQVKKDDVWETVVKVENNSEVDFSAELETPVSGQYFRLWMPEVGCSGDNVPRIGEFCLYGEETSVEPEVTIPDYTTALSYGKTATVNTQNGDAGAELAVDGVISTKWCAIDTTVAHWLEVDLGKPCNVDKWLVHSAGAIEDPNYITCDFQLEVKDSTGNWNVVETVTDNTEDVFISSLSESVTGQYFRLYVTKGANEIHPHVSRIHEFCLFGEEASAEPEVTIPAYNTALSYKRPASANTYYGDAGAEFAVDGDIATKWCSIAEGAHWLEVDLGESCNVDKWLVHSAGAIEDPDYITCDFRLEVKDSTGNWIVVETVTDNTDDVFISSLPEPVTGQNFRLYVTKGANEKHPHVSRIHEFCLFGEPADGARDATGVKLNKTNMSIQVGQTETLTASMLPIGAQTENLTWSSSDPTVAAVDANGIVTALKVGKTTITVSSASGLQDACNVNVTAGVSSAWEFGDNTDFINTLASANNATMSVSIFDGKLAITGQQTAASTADNPAYVYQTIYSGLDLEIGDDTKLSYIIQPYPGVTQNSAEMRDLTSLYIAVDLKFSDGTYLSDLNILDENCVGIHPNAQGEGKAMMLGYDNMVIVNLAGYSALKGKVVTDILVGYENASGEADKSFSANIDSIKISAPEREYNSLTDYVYTTRGSNGDQEIVSRGNAQPFVAVPHGFNLWVPDNDARGDNREIYRYDRNYINSFRCSHMANFYIGEVSMWNFMVTNGGTGSTNYSHDNTVAKAHYYSVEFDKNGSGQAAGTKVEMSPTDHGVAVRFTYDANLTERGVWLDQVTINEDGTFSGTIAAKNDNSAIEGDMGIEQMYVYGEFDTTPSSINNATNTAYFEKAESGKTVVTMTLATSYISIDQAEKNYELELIEEGETKAFDQVFEEAEEIWNEKLGVVTIEATDEQKINFYSSLYRFFLYPTSLAEYTGENKDSNEKYAGWQYMSPSTKQVEDGKMYYNNGFWDTYRTTWPLYTLLEPAQAAEMIDGFLNHYEDTGWIPRWSSAGGLNCTPGTSSDIVFGDAYTRGVTDFDLELAYEASLKNATMSTYGDALGSRNGLNISAFLGYVPEDVAPGQGLSWAQAGYLNDFGIAQLAKAVGDTNIYDYMMNRALGYVYHFDTNYQWFRTRFIDGSEDWTVDLDPMAYGVPYLEAFAWIMAFDPVWDGQGLVNLYGGEDELAEKLDALFACEDINTLSTGFPTVTHEQSEMPHVKMGVYEHNNQPAHHIPYMYLFANQPWKTQEKVRQVLRQCYNSSQIGGGYIGDDDNGENSAWYIWSSLGMYPLNLGTGELVFGSPLFTEAVIHLENGNMLTISAPNNNAENIYVNGVTINGNTYNKTSILQTELTKQDTALVFEMADTSNMTWGVEDGTEPTSITKDEKIPVPHADFIPGDVNILTESPEETSENGVYSAATTELAKLFDNNSLTGATLTPVDGTITVEFSFSDMNCVSMYTLTSHQDIDSAPAVFALYAYDGAEWIKLDEETEHDFLWKTQTCSFSVEDPAYYSRYRLVITASEEVTLSEIELMGNNLQVVDRSELLAAIAEVSSMDLTAYPEPIQTEIENAIAEAKAVAENENAEPEEVHEAYNNFKAVLDANLGAYIELSELYHSYKDQKQNFYTSASWTALQTALSKAEEVLDSDTSDADTIIAAKDDLLDAIGNLNVDYTTSLNYQLNGESVKANHVNADGYAEYAMDGISEGGGLGGESGGSSRTKWCATQRDTDGTYWLWVDLGEIKKAGSWILESASREHELFITNNFSLAYSTDNQNWVKLQEVTDNTENIYKQIFETPIEARYFKLIIGTPPTLHQGDTAIRIYEFHMYEYDETGDEDPTPDDDPSSGDELNPQVTVEYYIEDEDGVRTQIDPIDNGQDNPFTVAYGDSWTIVIGEEGGNYYAPKKVEYNRNAYIFDAESSDALSNSSITENVTVELVYIVEEDEEDEEDERDEEDEEEEGEEESFRLPIIKDGTLEITKILTAPDGFTGDTTYTFEIYRTSGTKCTYITSVEVEADDSEKVKLEMGRYLVVEVDAEEEGYELTTVCSDTDQIICIESGKRVSVTFENIYEPAVEIEMDDPLVTSSVIRTIP